MYSLLYSIRSKITDSLEKLVLQQNDACVPTKGVLVCNNYTLKTEKVAKPTNSRLAKS